MTAQSTEEAMALLRRTRRQQIDCARIIARELIAAEGSTHARRVHEAMTAQHLINPSIPDHWLGAVFRGSEFRWTGEWHQAEVPTKAKNTHEWRPIKVWELRA